MFRFVPSFPFKACRGLRNTVASYSTSSDNSSSPPEDPSKLVKWAKERGAYTYTHWFSTLRGNNGEKHDTLEYPFDVTHPTYQKNPYGNNVFFSKNLEELKTIALLKNMNTDHSKLFSGESDGSSFPSGGLRDTHRAGGYTIRDTSSPPFVYKETLYLPSTFVSFCGEPLDEKTPLLRSQSVINTSGTRLLRALGDKSSSGVVVNLGWEQEFFVVDRSIYSKRPDLVLCGRSILGKLPAKSQQTNANYFARQSPRVRKYLDAVRDQLWGLGIPVSTAHSEVAPAQYEISPVFTLSNISSDQNLISMEIMRDIAEEHNLAVIFHEKPFKGINGSGKHANWGLNIKGTGENLLTPGKTAEAQRRFIIFVAALTRAVDLYSDILRAIVGTAGNDHRLGAHEAPPAIISMYTGEFLESHIKKIIEGGELEGYSKKNEVVNISLIDTPTNYKKPLEDRNRTSPFPFCSNRFEFRAVGASQTLASPISYLNAIVADSLNFIASEIESGKSARDVAAQIFINHGRIIFNGDGYSKDWVSEAEKRGLPNLKNCAEALSAFKSQKNIDLLERTKVLSAKGLEARVNVYYYMYNQQVLMEANCLIEMINTGILPAAIRDYTNLSNSGLPQLSNFKTKKATLLEAISREIEQLSELVRQQSTMETEDFATFCSTKIIPQMAVVRRYTDELEGYIDKSLYPYPKYDDLVFSLNIN